MAVESVSGHRHLDISPIRRPVIIAPLGMEFSGKSELTRRIMGDFRAVSVSAGDMVRAAATRNETELDKVCAATLGKGYLKGEDALRVVGSWFAEPKDNERMVFDGFLRSVEETKGFFPMLSKHNVQPRQLVFVFLRTPVWVPHLRMEHSTEKQKTGESLRAKRDDDTPEKLLNRMRAYHTNLGARMSYIKNTHMGEWILSDTHNKSSEEVYENVKKHLVQLI